MSRHSSADLRLLKIWKAAYPSGLFEHREVL